MNANTSRNGKTKLAVNFLSSRYFKKFFCPRIELHVLPGGRAPERKTKGAIGYDAYLRAVVSNSEMDEKNPNLRKLLFDFENLPKDPKIRKHIHWVRNGKGGKEMVYRMRPHESVLVGIGFVTAMPFPLFYWVAPRSGLASRWGITVTNAPAPLTRIIGAKQAFLYTTGIGTVLTLKRNMRIAQIIFQWAIIPEITIVPRYDKLSNTGRGAGGFGSTGLMG